MVGILTSGTYSLIYTPKTRQKGEGQNLTPAPVLKINEAS